MRFRLTVEDIWAFKTFQVTALGDVDRCVSSGDTDFKQRREEGDQRYPGLFLQRALYISCLLTVRVELSC